MPDSRSPLRPLTISINIIKSICYRTLFTRHLPETALHNSLGLPKPINPCLPPLTKDSAQVIQTGP